ncbi:SHOCT domain-containing protein [Paenibacillus sinopodophylli]|uniref:SHOCT domain-containing protein n=1 Tax=Paenibacillus sinopodophylli TaxID=1837342 RepID=UPI00110D03BD|nr:SHOCT domain-containing protein [Paenibacillus sinopodophylli]
MTNLIVFLIGLFGTLIFLVVSLVSLIKAGILLNKKLDTQIKDMINDIGNFNVSQDYVSNDRENYIAIDETSKRVAFVYNQEINTSTVIVDNLFSYKCAVYSYANVLQSSIILDGNTVSTASSMTTIGRSLLGGFLAGKTGAIIGGLSAARTTENQVKKILLQIVVNDIAKSFHTITFGSFPKGAQKDNLSFKDAESKVTHWHNILSFLIKQVDDAERSDPSNNSKGNSVADELTKLSMLVRDGLMTHEEFNQQKIRLLSQ